MTEALWSSKLYAALTTALDKQEATIHREYVVSTPGGLRRFADFVIEHREWGLFVIEVTLGRSFALSNALHQAQTHLWDILEQHRAHDDASGLIGHALVFAPDIAEDERRRARLPEAGDLNRPIIFADELEPDVLRRKLREAPTIIESGEQELPTRPRKAQKKEYDVFISYRRLDSAWAAGRIADHLGNEFGPENIFHDIQSVGLGRDFVEVIRRRIESTDVLLVIIGERWLNIADPESGIRRLDREDDFVRWEVRLGLEEGLLVVPVLIDDNQMPRSEHLPEPLQPLANRNACRIWAEHFETDFQRLLDELQSFLGKTGEAI